MDDIASMKGLDALANLADYSPSYVLIERYGLLLANEIKEIASRHKLRNDIIAVVILERLDQLENVWAGVAIDFLHDLELLKLLVVGFECSINLPFANDFNRTFDIRVLMF